jgi:hypothetical protein
MECKQKVLIKADILCLGGVILKMRPQRVIILSEFVSLRHFQV